VIARDIEIGLAARQPYDAAAFVVVADYAGLHARRV